MSPIFSTWYRPIFLDSLVCLNGGTLCQYHAIAYYSLFPSISSSGDGGDWDGDDDEGNDDTNGENATSIHASQSPFGSNSFAMKCFEDYFFD